MLLNHYVLYCSYHILTLSVMYYWTDARQNGIYLLNRKIDTELRIYVWSDKNNKLN